MRVVGLAACLLLSPLLSACGHGPKGLAAIDAFHHAYRCPRIQVHAERLTPASEDTFRVSGCQREAQYRCDGETCARTSGNSAGMITDLLLVEDEPDPVH